MSLDSVYWSTDIYKFISALRKDAILLITPTLDPQKIWERIERYKVNTIECCPHHAILLAIAGKPKDLDTSSLIKLIVLGGVFPARYREDLQKMIPTTIIIPVYGCTEVGSITSFFNDWPEHMQLMKMKPDSVGLPRPGLIIKIVDPETGKSLGPNQQGELRVKKKIMMNGYYNLDASNDFDEDGFFKTGDILYYDEDYCFFFVDRIKELLIYQGYHVLPAVIESRLMQHPAVKRAAVVGKKHDVDGELPTAFIEVKEGYENFDSHELRKFVDDNMPDTHKLRGGIIVLDKIPATPSNKVKRGTLKKLLESEYQNI
ncbi:unnamed protein product [Callosobruchus maculatus]|uniref:AMP-dependent synthetase/ligase domain-containing protein n=1 Tax=Callosobruchus maculatus TaxID=64391 RepID=A0A653CMM0_CALMS|nr:unnamed protein product [Callosobruchus maculatus]